MRGRCLTGANTNVADIEVFVRNNIHEYQAFVSGVHQERALLADVVLKYESSVLLKLISYLRSQEINIDIGGGDILITATKLLRLISNMDVENKVNLNFIKNLRMLSELSSSAKIKIYPTKTLKFPDIYMLAMLGSHKEGAAADELTVRLMSFLGLNDVDSRFYARNAKISMVKQFALESGLSVDFNTWLSKCGRLGIENDNDLSTWLKMAYFSNMPKIDVDMSFNTGSFPIIVWKKNWARMEFTFGGMGSNGQTQELLLPLIAYVKPSAVESDLHSKSAIVSTKRFNLANHSVITPELHIQPTKTFKMLCDNIMSAKLCVITGAIFTIPNIGISLNSSMIMGLLARNRIKHTRGLLISNIRNLKVRELCYNVEIRHRAR
jgi:hypothetical protein